MKLDELKLELVWPRELLEWEASQIGGKKEWLEHLLRDAFHDPDGEVTSYFSKEVSGVAHLDPWSAKASREPTEVFQEILNARQVTKYERRKYYAERNLSTVKLATPDLGEEFLRVLLELSEHGYFEDLIETLCVDGSYREPDETQKDILRSTGLDVDFEVFKKGDPFLSLEKIYTLIEFFHDRARRPRAARYHNFSDCGWDYYDHNVRSGQVVYRWRMNQVLEDCKSEYRLASEGPDIGFLVTTFEPAFDEMIAKVSTEVKDDAYGEVTGAIQSYRKRGATRAEKKAAVNLLANEIEPHRPELNALLGRSSEKDLFQIANNFAIRHRNKFQKDDYGDEFLDWLFLTFLSVIHLVSSIEARAESSRPTGCEPQ